MRRAERLFRLVDEMRSNRVSRAGDLARKMEVSISTIYRDIAHLQASGLPIEGEAGIGYMLRPGFDMPSVSLTHDQVQALAIGLAYVETTGDPDLATAAREVRAKMQASMPEPEQRILADAPFFSLHGQSADADAAALMRRAIRERLIVQFGYRNGTGTVTSRRARPLVAWALPDGTMVSCYCQLRQDFRNFRMDRMSDLMATGEHFSADGETGLQAFMDHDARNDTRG